MVSMVDLHSGKEVVGARQIVRSDGTANGGVSMVFGFDSSKRLADQMLVVGLGRSLHVFGESK